MLTGTLVGVYSLLFVPLLIYNRYADILLQAGSIWTVAALLPVLAISCSISARYAMSSVHSMAACWCGDGHPVLSTTLRAPGLWIYGSMYADSVGSFTAKLVVS